VRRTPVVSILVWNLLTAGFVVWGYFEETTVVIAVLTCNLTALVWYILAMICLFVLRAREPNMPCPYRVPLYPLLPAAVIVLGLVAVARYGVYNAGETLGISSTTTVLWITAAMYAMGLAGRGLGIRQLVRLLEELDDGGLAAAVVASINLRPQMRDCTPGALRASRGHG
jgi:amino acid transporter